MAVARKSALSAYFSKIGKKGADSRLANTTPEKRIEVARIAAAKSAEVRSAKAAARKQAKLLGGRTGKAGAARKTAGGKE